MDYLPKTLPTQNSKFSKDKLLIGGLFVLGGLIIFSFLVRHHQKQMRMAQMARIQRYMASTQNFKVHLKTLSLDKLSADKKFPTVATLTVDGKQIMVVQQPKYFDKFLVLNRGSHTIIVRMWNTQKKLTEKKYQVNVGIPAPAKKVAQR